MVLRLGVVHGEHDDGALAGVHLLGGRADLGAVARFEGDLAPAGRVVRRPDDVQLVLRRDEHVDEAEDLRVEPVGPGRVGDVDRREEDAHAPTLRAPPEEGDEHAVRPVDVGPQLGRWP